MDLINSLQLIAPPQPKPRLRRIMMYKDGTRNKYYCHYSWFNEEGGGNRMEEVSAYAAKIGADMRCDMPGFDTREEVLNLMLEFYNIPQKDFNTILNMTSGQEQTISWQ